MRPEGLETANAEMIAVARLAAIVESSDDAIIGKALDGTVTSWNASAERIFGYSAEEIIGRSVNLLVPDHRLDEGSKILDQIKQGQRVEHFETVRRRKDGTLVHISLSISPIKDETGQIIGASKIARDITKHQQAEDALRRSLKDLADIKFALDQSSIVAITDTEGTITYANDKFCEISKYSKSELIGQNHHIVNSGCHPKSFFQQMWAAISLGQVWQGEIQNRAKDGTFYWIDMTVVPFLGQNGKPYQYAAVCSEITVRKQVESELQELNEELESRIIERTAELAQINQTLQSEIGERQQIEEALQQSQQMLQLVINTFPQRVFWKDKNFRYLGCNTIFARDAGLESPEQIVGRDDFELAWKESAPLYRADDQFVIETNVPKVNYEESQVREDGTFFWLRTNKIPLHNDAKEVIGVFGSYEDISDRKQAEAMLQEQEQFLRSIYDNVEYVIFVLDVLDNGEFRYVGWNANAAKGSGLSSAEVAGKTPKEVFGSEAGEEITQALSQCLQVGTMVTDEKRLMFQEQEFWSIATLNPLHNSEGKIYRIVGTSFDISDRKRAEVLLQQQKEQLEHALKELQQMQMQLVQSEKMSGLGQLVAGVAHEINNPVNFIYGNLIHANEYTQDLLGLLRLYQQHHPNPHPTVQAEADAIDLEFLIDDLPKLLSSMKVGADRIQKIVASLRTFSRMDEAEMKEVNIHEGIDSTLMILQNRIKTKSDRLGIEVVRDYSNLPLVECYAGQLNQVFMNILSNAIDALEESSKDTSGLRQDLIESSELAEAEQNSQNSNTTKLKEPYYFPRIQIRTELVDQNHVSVHFIDNGIGIPEHVKQRLFDPFFTTKPIGKGTGMGLSISYQIIAEKHKGSLQCHSLPGQGTEFVLTIPTRQS
ncbi:MULTISPECIES: PAS domain S-box protein [unclassified Leptolyngbya]|uniref:PAS domain-containing sensor histidine kinase n=1 Tax=unclassified Leptolyngbya TaxID=2650499 RepID=UPI001682CEF1|nr:MULTISPECIES: PAS domain S-box protein [unclassified Leptolyngbya]MBD1909229.1 PAS domain S-box protein [Leptolyngbya sp. FACHB-8]MBD2158827.1 PAS domain S-box protein [Leptolyngbya sp. FACHB-16]